MDEKPKSSWFRFRLSTVLILTTIAAWANGMLAVVEAARRTPTRRRARPNWQDNLLLPGERFTAAELRQTPEGEVVRIGIARYALNPHLKWPALAVAALIAWKLTWRIVERRRMSSNSAA